MSPVSPRAPRPVFEAAACGLRCAALAALAAACHAALAADASDAVNDSAPMVLALATVGLPAAAAMATASERGGPQLEVTTTSLPRFDNTDNGNRTSRLDMTWMAPRRSALGLSLGMTSPDTASTQFASANRIGLTPSMDVGVQWRYTLDGNYRFDVTAYRRVMPADALTLIQTRDGATYGARVEMSVGGGIPKRGLVAERGFIGLQLENGARVVLRRFSGGPMVYYRSKF